MQTIWTHCPETSQDRGITAVLTAVETITPMTIMAEAVIITEQAEWAG